MYKDKKKYLWLMSSVLPLVGTVGVLLFVQLNHAWLLLLPLVFIYVVIPLMDYLLPNDPSNPTESVVPDLEKQAYYSWILYLMLPAHFVSFFYLLWALCHIDFNLWQQAVVLLTMGVFGGLAVNLGHELGHKKNQLDKNLAKLALASSAYGHFNIEHNAGHHREVATPEDTASAKMNEHIYRFFWREWPGGLKRAWRIERQRLARKGLPWWSKSNQILHSYALTLLMVLMVFALLGGMGVVFWLLHMPLVWWQLTSANYIEHYGLLRQKKDNGQYEKCQPHHSWNSNHLFSNLVLFHLQRHSDHHANPSRSYQSLRHFDDVPQLPTGYMGMFVLAYVPPLWFKVMNPKLKASAGSLINQ
ncbi:alkane 1-monooxygenase [Marinicella rhabdoformis]|uniref:alkane 1-monooxygenase n=1 Tax=Marinicella rhabdoformis TaxID=2580566 RepID=UPI0012AEB251|nr:alkane 1-monooxygenase [Marinicella rhabdoformis]